MDIKGKTIEKKNKKYFFVESIGVNMEPEKLTMKFENLFNGNKALS